MWIDVEKEIASENSKKDKNREKERASAVVKIDKERNKVRKRQLL